MSTKLILLQGGTVLTHDAEDHVHPILADILIEGNIITKLEKQIAPPSGAEIIDCRDKILSPGFIDTHHHVWQTLLKGRHGDQLLLDYFAPGNFTSSIHSAAEVFWGELGGCLECLDVGTTTVVDFAHMNYSPETINAAVAATISSGIRSVFCYCPTPRVASWEPFSLAQDMLADWVMEGLDKLAAKAPFGDGRVSLGFAFDGFWFPKEVLVPLFDKVKGLGIKVITTHYGRNVIQGYNSLPEIVQSYGHLDHTWIFAHACNATQTDAKLLSESNSYVSSTPSTELQMAMGTTVAFDPDLDIDNRCSLGIDCQSNNSASLVSEMRILLQAARASHDLKFVKEMKAPRKVYKTVEQAFNLGTINGARAVNMEDQIGSLAVGKKADILVWDKLSPGMICAAEQDPVAAIVLHSSPSDIEIVIVDGIVRKRGAKLETVDLSAGKELWSSEETVGKVEWKDVAKQLVKKRVGLEEKIAKLDFEMAKEGVIKAFYIDESKIVDFL